MKRDESPRHRNFKIIKKHVDTLYLFWSDERNGNYEIYFSKGESMSIIPGDANQDLTVDILDVVLIINFVLGQQEPTNPQFMASDINLDNIINIQDIILLVNIILYE